MSARACHLSEEDGHLSPEAGWGPRPSPSGGRNARPTHVFSHLCIFRGLISTTVGSAGGSCDQVKLGVAGDSASGTESNTAAHTSERKSKIGRGVLVVAIVYRVGEGG